MVEQQMQKFQTNVISDVDSYLNSKGISEFDLDLPTIKQIARQNKEECYPVVIDHTLSLTDIGANVAIGTKTGGAQVTFNRRYINELVDHDLILTFTLTHTPGATFSTVHRTNFDSLLYSLKITGRTNNQILMSTTQDELFMLPLASQIKNFDNVNLKANNINGNIFSMRNDVESIVATAKTTKYKVRLSELAGGKNGFFGKMSYLQDEHLNYEITFSPTWSFLVTGGANETLSTEAYTVTIPVDAANIVVVGVQQIVYKIPGIVRKEIELQKHYIKHDTFYRVTKQDISGTGTTTYQFNISVNKSMFQNKFTGLFIGDNLNTAPFVSSNLAAQSAISLGAQAKQVIQNNRFHALTMIQVKVGQQTLVDLDSNAKVTAYFMATMSQYNLTQDTSKSIIYLGEEIMDQFSNLQNVVISVKLVSAENIATADLFCYVFGEAYQIMSGGTLNFFDSSMLQY